MDQWARAGEVLSLNIEDLDLEFRRARITSKGGAIEHVHWHPVPPACCAAVPAARSFSPTVALPPSDRALPLSRTSALQHLAADGRTAPEPQANSRHQHLGSLGRCVRLGEETSARVTAEADPAARRRTR
ncbi:hypothetical protein [Nonomuraea sp. NPDC049141]|uniref:hypothetical protein n=1 Tax=Nonomuraea sp. NPDC049141 TaxID=3155500 RepID=UPI0033C0E53A